MTTTLGLDTKFENQTQTIGPVDWRFGYYGNIGKRLFELASCKPLPDDIGTWPAAIVPLIKNLYAGQDRPLPKLEKKGTIRKTKAGKEKLAVVGFTGGRDSVAITCMLMAEGYKVHLLHLSGLNRSHYYEKDNCRAIAEYMDVPLTIRHLKFRGTSGDLSNRLRNQFIMCQQLDFAEEIGGTAITQGNHQADNLGNITNWIWFADAQENYQAYQKAFKGNIEFRTSLCVNPSMVYAKIKELRPDLLTKLGSCVHPHMYRNLRRKQTKTKYGIDLLPYRCGICYKCCWEYLIFCEMTDLYGKPDQKYAMHCLDVVREKWHYFYNEDLRPINRVETLKAIIDQKYVSTPTIIKWANESEAKK